MSISNTFIRNVVHAWCDASFVEPQGNFSDQILWNNSSIKLNSKVVFNDQLFNLGLVYLRDIFDQNGRPLVWESFRNTFPAPGITFLFYWGLLSSIPNAWRADIILSRHAITQNSNQLFYRKIMHSHMVSQLVYRRLIVNVVSPPTAMVKWCNEFPDISIDAWDYIFRSPWATTRETKIVFFQFKFLHRILPTNRLLYLMGKTDSQLCTFCQREVESIGHLFWDCTFSSTFILDVEGRFLGNQFVFSKQDIFFGYQYSLCHPYNFLILHLKYYLFSCKLQSIKPNVNSFYYKFKFALQTEEYIYFKWKRKSKGKINYLDLKDAFSVCESLFEPIDS